MLTKGRYAVCPKSEWGTSAEVYDSKYCGLYGVGGGIGGVFGSKFLSKLLS